MKKIVISLLTIFITFFFFAPFVFGQNASEKGKANAPDLEKIEFIHYKKGFAKPEAAKSPKPPSCYKFLTPGKNPIRWQVPPPVEYVLNPTNINLPPDFICSAVKTSAETWDAATLKKELFRDYVNGCQIGSWEYGVLDEKNAITFGDYSQKDVIAVTTVWYNPALRSIAEFDIMFDTDWTWGDADPNNDEVVDYPSLMDLQNIATHEFGHGVGLADVYGSVCSAVTMYGYSDYGETQKRDLADPDIKGLQTLYP